MKIHHHLQTIPPDRVRPGGPSLFWAQDPDPELRASIRDLGQLAPVIVASGPKGPELLAGHKRLRALTALARPVLAISAEADDLERGLIYLADNQGRALDHGMRLAALRYFAPLVPAEDLARDIGPKLGLGTRSGDLARLLAWLSLPKAFDPHLAEGRLPLAAGPILAGLGPGDLTALEPFFRALRWSRGAALNFLTWLFEAARAQGRAVAELDGYQGLLEVLGRGLSPNDALAALQALARQMRFPVLSGLEARSRELCAGLCAAGPWRAAQTQNFETGAVDLWVRVADRKGLERAVDALSALAGSEAWDGLWSIGD
ncbi:MAG: ParB N-terminal domain-containing protein [Desulfovibrionaceae bacterium]|nr:ParB N-terminal domain-containing protein [Desulfovibrionaceae bacterium]